MSELIAPNPMNTALLMSILLSAPALRAACMSQLAFALIIWNCDVLTGSRSIRFAD